MAERRGQETRRRNSLADTGYSHTVASSGRRHRLLGSAMTCHVDDFYQKTTDQRMAVMHVANMSVDAGHPQWHQLSISRA